jgi:hypothetical protein
MTRDRSKVHLYPFRSTVYGAIERMPNSDDWEPKADLQRGNGTGGVLVRHKVTELYALWTADETMETIPQQSIAKALEELKE